MRSCTRLAILVVLLSVPPAVANAGTITSTVGGLATITVSPSGALVTIDSVITFGPTTVGGAGAFIEASFDYFGTAVGGGGTPTFPSGWLDATTGGIFTCVAGHCENIVGALDASGFGAAFPSGSTFALPSVTVDTTGLAPGIYAMGAGLTGPGDLILAPGLDVSSEYISVGAIIYVAPEPGTAALLALGLVLLAVTRSR